MDHIVIKQKVSTNQKQLDQLELVQQKPVARDGGMLTIDTEATTRMPTSQHWERSGQTHHADIARELQRGFFQRHSVDGEEDDEGELNDHDRHPNGTIVEDELFEWKRTRLHPDCKKWVLIEGVRYCHGGTSTGYTESDRDSWNNKYKTIHPKHGGSYRKDTSSSFSFSGPPPKVCCCCSPATLLLFITAFVADEDEDSHEV